MTDPSISVFPQPCVFDQRYFRFEPKKNLAAIDTWYFDVWQTNIGQIRACASDQALFSMEWLGTNQAPSQPDSYPGITTPGCYDPNILEQYRRHVMNNAGNKIGITLFGTPFQCQVWRTLLDLEDNNLISYSELARLTGCDKGQRAVGSAVGANPVFLLVPCHRVIRSNGTLGGYAYGLDLKQRILDLEQQGTLLQA